MRTTLTLDDDVAEKLKATARKSGRPFKDVVNELLRAALASSASRKRGAAPFRIEARPLGLRKGLSYDCVSELLEAAEGPLYK